MRVGIVDADLLERSRHRFPNLAVMKLSAWHKSQGDDVELLDDWMGVLDKDLSYVSKVFTDTDVPVWVESAPNVVCGGTGFFYDRAEPLPHDVEHMMPDYRVYDAYFEKHPEKSKSKTKYYTDYSIGFMTRGCFRKCSFCVNRNSNASRAHSELSEFYDPSRKKICLLDDNFLACPQWREMLIELRETGKPFEFKQGLDERLLTDEKCELLFSSKYDGEFIFAFDDVSDYDLIGSKLEMIRRHTDKVCKFYVLCGYDRAGLYNESFFEQDIVDTFKRIDLLRDYGCLPYIMRHENYKNSPYAGMYINLARWCNQPSLFKKMSFYDFCKHPDHLGGATERYYDKFMGEQSYMNDSSVWATWQDAQELLRR